MDTVELPRSQGNASCFIELERKEPLMRPDRIESNDVVAKGEVLKAKAKAEAVLVDLEGKAGKVVEQGENKLEDVTHAVQETAKEVFQNAKELASKAERRFHRAADKVRDKLNGRS
jgi:hypothetical protein